MSRGFTFRHQFVECIPDELEDRTIYVSIPFATAAHKCCCGCGSVVITPITPTDWALLFDGETVSLSPSIGNWSFECRSHYWIERNKVKWSEEWSQAEVETGRSRDVDNKKKYYDAVSNSAHDHSDKKFEEPRVGKPRKNLWQRLTGWFR